MLVSLWMRCWSPDQRPLIRGCAALFADLFPLGLWRGCVISNRQFNWNTDICLLLRECLLRCGFGAGRLTSAIFLRMRCAFRSCLPAKAGICSRKVIGVSLPKGKPLFTIHQSLFTAHCHPSLIFRQHRLCLHYRFNLFHYFTG